MAENGMQTTQTQNATGPSWALPYQQYAQNQAYSQFQGVNSPTQLVAPFSSQQNQAIQGITNLATNGTPTTGAAQDYVTKVLNGQPASNPYLDSMFNRAADQTQNRLASEFAGAGRNVDQSQGLRSQQLNDLATQIYGGAYNTGVQQQENALTQAVPLAQQQFNAQQQLYNAGVPIQQLAQQYITAPQQFLQQYLNQVNQVPGQSITTQQPYSPALQAMSGANIGGQLGSAIGGLFGDNGTKYGGLLGTIAGAFTQ